MTESNQFHQKVICSSARVYAKAARHGRRLSVHAGVTVGPASISGAHDVLKAERIGHALYAEQDPALIQRLVRDQVPLELCVTSNLRTSCCAEVSAHPLRRYFDADAIAILVSPGALWAGDDKKVANDVSAIQAPVVRFSGELKIEQYYRGYAEVAGGRGRVEKSDGRSQILTMCRHGRGHSGSVR